MTDSSLACLVSLALGGIVAILAGRALGVRLFGDRTAKRLRDAERTAGAAVPSLDAEKLRGLARSLVESGLPITAMQFRLLCAALGLAGAIFGWIFFVPGLPSLMIGGVLAYVPWAYMNERILTRGVRIDRHLPITASRIAAGLQAQADLPEVLETAARHLPDGNPLSPELVKTAQDIRSEGAGAAFERLAARSKSVSLANLAMLLESYDRAGGGQYANIVSEAAVGIQRMVSVRNRARARASQALQASVIIPAVLVVVLVMMAGDPSVRSAFGMPVVQITIALSMGVMALGYLYMRSQVRKVV